MKKLLAVILTLSISLLLNAQTYVFSKSTGTYTTLTSPTVVSTSTPWTPFQSHVVPIGFNFLFFDQSFSTIYIEGSGFTRFDASYFYLLHPFTVQMEDAGTGGPTSLSPLSYELTGSMPNRILKIQWENCEMVNDPGSFANFQLWLYESTAKIEVHYGNINVINPANAFMGHSGNGPIVGLYDDVQDFGHMISGAPPSESQLNVSGITSMFDYSMNGVPSNGTIYTFSLSTSLEGSSEDFIGIYPNPADDFINFYGLKDFSFVLKDQCGKIVLQGMSNTTIDLKDLPAGVYYLETYIWGKWHSKKLIKQ